jgi:DNA polymerase III epsilon subunit-like protein
MIVLDLEFSGSDYQKYGIWQIGAIDLLDPNRKFIGECRIDDDEGVNPESLVVCNITEEYIRDKNKKSQKELITEFFEWVKKSKINVAICQGPQMDWAFLKAKAFKYELEFPFDWRAFDLHSIAAFKYFELNNKLYLDNNHSAMSLSRIIEFCGMIDRRDAHNALEDAELTAECFSRIFYGKKLLEKYDEYAMPEYLIMLN